MNKLLIRYNICFVLLHAATTAECVEEQKILSKMYGLKSHWYTRIFSQLLLLSRLGNATFKTYNSSIKLLAYKNKLGIIYVSILVPSSKLYVLKISLTLWEGTTHFLREKLLRSSSFSLAQNVYDDVLKLRMSKEDLVQLYTTFNINVEVCNRRRISTSVTTTSITTEVQAHWRCHQYVPPSQP